MNPREALLNSLFNFKDEIEVTSKPWARKGMFIGSIMSCARYQLISIKTPKTLNGVTVPYIKQVQMSSNGDYIVNMGNTIEDVMRKHINYRKIPILADQTPVEGLGGFVRGRLDFGLEIEGIGFCIIDAKGMSDQVFARFQASSLKDFKLDYYMQVVHYIHEFQVNYGYIAGVNRNNGAVAFKEVSLEASKEDYENSMNRAKLVQATSIENYDSLPVDKDEVCTQCEYVMACRPDFYKDVIEPQMS